MTYTHVCIYSGYIMLKKACPFLHTNSLYERLRHVGRTSVSGKLYSDEEVVMSHILQTCNKIVRRLTL